MIAKRLTLPFIISLFMCVLCLGVADVRAQAVPGPSITSLTAPTHPDENTWYAFNDPLFEWSALTLIGTFPSGYARGVAVSGNFAYVADQLEGLQIADISNPAAPVLAGKFRTPSYAMGVALSGGYAYVADGFSGLQIIDVSNPAAPTPAGSYTTPSYAHGVVISGNYAYVAADFSGLQIIDVSNPAAPSLAGSYNSPGTVMGVAVTGGFAYVADYNTGLQIIDVSNPAAPVRVSGLDTPDFAVGVALSGSHAYVSDTKSGLQIIDVSNPAAPAPASSYDTPGDALGVTISGNYAFVSDGGSGLRIVNVSNPAAPRLADRFDTSGSALGITVSGGYAYVADYNGGLRILNANLPSGYSYAIDQSPGTIPDAIPEGADVSSSYLNLADGDWYFHLRAQDAAGSWGPVTQRRIRIDTGAPAITNIVPTGSVGTNDAIIAADLSDAGSGVNAASSAISLDGGPAIEICTRTATSISCPASGLGPGLHTIVVTVSDNAGNRGSGSGSFSVSSCKGARPALSLRLSSVYWQSYADYMARLLSVGYSLNNSGTDMASGVVINSATATRGVTLASEMPLTLGEIISGAGTTFSLKYDTPVSVTSFRTTVNAAAQDGCGNPYLYPGI